MAEYSSGEMRELDRVTAQVAETAKKTGENYDKLLLELKRIGEESKKLTQYTGVLNDTLADAASGYRELVKENNKFKSAASDMVDAYVHGFGDLVEDANGSFAKIAKSAGMGGLKSAAKFGKHFSVRLKKEMDDLKTKTQTGQATVADAIRMKSLQQQEAASDKILKRLEVGRIEALKGTKDDMAAAFKSKNFRGMGKVFSEFGEMASSGALGGVAEGIATSALGKGALQIGAKAVPIAGQIIAVGSLINDAVTGLDNYMKKTNQQFAAMAGPQFDGDQFVEASKNYNKQIRNVSLNTELGVNADEWNAMFQSMSQAGVGVDQMSKRLGDQREIMKSVRSTSLELGIGMDAYGQMVVESALEMKSGLSTTSKSFESVANGASKAGMTADRFYGSIRSAVLAMASYGNYTELAAASLAKLAKNAGLSQKQAEDLANTYLTMGANMDAAGKIAFTALVETQMGSKGVQNMVKQEIASIDAKLKRKDLSDDERNKLTSNRAVLQGSLKSGDTLSLASVLPYLTSSMSKMAIEVVRNTTGRGASDIFKSVDSGQFALLVKNLPGMNEKLALEMQTALQADRATLSNPLDALNKSIKEMREKDPEQVKTLLGIADQLQLNPQATSDAQKATLSTYFNSLVASGKMTNDDLKNLDNALTRSPKSVGKLLYAALKSGGKMDSAALAVAIQEQTTDETDMLTKQGKKGQGTQIRALTEMEKLYGITQDSIFYNMASSEAATASAAALYDIKKGFYKFLGKYLGTSEYDDPDKAASDAAAAANEASGTLENLKKSADAVKDMTPAQALEDYKAGGATKDLAASLGITDEKGLSAYLQGSTVAQFASDATNKQAKIAQAAKTRSSNVQDDANRLAFKKSQKESFAEEHPYLSYLDVGGYISSGGIGGGGYSGDVSTDVLSPSDKSYLKRMDDGNITAAERLKMLTEWQDKTQYSDADIDKKIDQYGLSYALPSSVSDIRSAGIPSYKDGGVKDGDGLAYLHDGETIIPTVPGSSIGSSGSAGSSKAGLVVHTVNIFDAVNVQEFMRLFDQKQVFNDKRASLAV